jgi:hypothetical protein
MDHGSTAATGFEEKHAWQTRGNDNGFSTIDPIGSDEIG